MRALTTLFILIKVLILCESTIRFTNVKCTHYDPTFATFPICRLNLLKRNTVALNIRVKLLQLPVTNSSVNLSLHKKASGYRPFLYNATFDYCEFQRNRKAKSFYNIFNNFVLKDSNLNHTCPYNDDIIVKNLLLSDDMFKMLPLPQGEYMWQVKVAAYNDWKADVKVYMEMDLGI